jgi:RHS repeat-associated protein
VISIRCLNFGELDSRTPCVFASDRRSELARASGDSRCSIWPQMGQSFQFDGFGNLLSQVVTKGSAPSLYVNVNASNNRITTSGYTYDANGNVTAAPDLSMGYDVENRMIQATHSANGTEWYAYDPANRRTEKGAGGEEYGDKYLYGVDGTLLGTYGRTNGPFRGDSWDVNVYFAGKQIWQKYSNGSWAGAVAPDRLGSVTYRSGGGTNKYFPYGGEATSTTEDHTKFATYYRDSTSTLDYARNRYYSSTFARFTTPDPFGGSASLGNPQSFNRYSYVGGDPVNFNDPEGLYRIAGTWRRWLEPIGREVWWDPEDNGDPGQMHKTQVLYAWRSEFIPLVGADPADNLDVAWYRAMQRTLKRRSLYHDAIYGTGDTVFGGEVLDCMAGVESTWTPTAENQWGFRGMFGIGKDAWNDVYANVPNPPSYLSGVFDPKASASVAAAYLNILLSRLVGWDNYVSGNYTDDDKKNAILRYNGSSIRVSYANEVWDCAQALKAGDVVTGLRSIFKAP